MSVSPEERELANEEASDARWDEIDRLEDEADTDYGDDYEIPN